MPHFPFDPEAHGFKLVLVDSRVKHELVDSPYNNVDSRANGSSLPCRRSTRMCSSCVTPIWRCSKRSPPEITQEDYKRARFVIGEVRRVLDVCDALERNDYETVGKRMYETHWGLSKDYEVSCVELDFLAEVAQACGVTGSRIMGGGFGGCTINLVKKELYNDFIATAKAKFNAEYGHEPKIYDVVISDGSRRL